MAASIRRAQYLVYHSMSLKGVRGCRGTVLRQELGGLLIFVVNDEVDLVVWV